MAGSFTGHFDPDWMQQDSETGMTRCQIRIGGN